MKRFVTLLALGLLFAWAWSVVPLRAETYDDPTMIDWKFDWEYSQSSFETLFEQRKSDGYRLDDLEVYSTFGGVRFAAVWRKADEYKWWAYWRQTRSEFDNAVVDLKSKGYRAIDIEVLNEGGEMRYSSVWIGNPENLAWRLSYDMTSESFNSQLAHYREAGYRPLNFEIYKSPWGWRYAMVWAENREQLPWVLDTWQSTREIASSSRRYDDLFEAGYRAVDTGVSIASDGRYMHWLYVKYPDTSRYSPVAAANYSEMPEMTAKYRPGFRPANVLAFPTTDNETAFIMIWRSNGYRRL